MELAQCLAVPRFAETKGDLASRDIILKLQFGFLYLLQHKQFECYHSHFIFPLTNKFVNIYFLKNLTTKISGLFTNIQNGRNDARRNDPPK